jgi:hypothetical protein
MRRSTEDEPPAAIGESRSYDLSDYIREMVRILGLIDPIEVCCLTTELSQGAL